MRESSITADLLNPFIHGGGVTDKVSGNQMIRVLVVNDDDRVGRGWQMRLALEPDIAVVGIVGEMKAAVSAATATHPRIILLDTKRPDPDDLSSIAVLHQATPEAAIIIVTAYDSAINRQEALLAGADAFISKQGNFDHLLALIRSSGTT